jgi:hypothetical protein
MARTIDELKEIGPSWGEDMKKYEFEKRRALDEGFLRPQQMKLTAGQMKSQERVFDPLLQRFRDNETEYKQRVLEETARIDHLNRAMDIQVLREQPHHILHHQSKFDAIAPGQDPTRQPDRQRKLVGISGVPDTQCDHNIITNIPFDDHHWGRPDVRPRHNERKGEQRKIQANRIRDFSIINNRYHDAHEARIRNDAELNLAEATSKYKKANRFDPVTQQFNDPKDEECARHCDDAREVETRLRLESQVPVTYTGRPTEFYDVVSNKVHDREMVKHMDTLENERKHRYRNRHIIEHNFHAQDVKGDHLTQVRKLNKVAPDRFLEQERGYCIVSNQSHGHGPKEKVIHAPFAQPRKSPWEEIEHSHALNGRSASMPSLSASAKEAQRPRFQDVRELEKKKYHPAVAVTQPPAPRGASGGSQPSRAGSQRSLGEHSALGEAGERTLGSTAQLRAPPGATRPIVRAPSEPALSGSGQPLVTTIDTRTRRMPTPFSSSMEAPPAPRMPGSPVGSVYSRPSAKAY